MQRLFSHLHDQIMQRERELLEELRVHIARLEAGDDDLNLLKTSLHQLDELFLLVVVGEFNAGKTAFLNAMLGNRLLTEGVTPTTAEIHLIRYGNPQRQEHTPDYLALYMPVEWLRDINLVDTPGTNAVIQRHQAITEHFVPRSDLVLFVTSADRPFSESERQFMERIRQWGKKVVLIVNKIDLIEGESDRKQILDFVRSNATQLLGSEPQIFPVSTRLALQAKLAGREAKQSSPAEPAWKNSQFGALEKYVIDTLDSGERIKLKLENPLGVAANLISKYNGVVEQRTQLLKGDFRTIDDIDANLEVYEADMRRDFKFQSSRIDNVLYEMAERGDKFFDETLRIGRIFDLINGEKLRGEFEREVVADTSRQIEQHVQGLIDWMVDKDYRQWQAVMEFLNQRAAQHSDRIVGKVGSNFEFNRQALLAKVGQHAQDVVDGYDRSAESLKLAQNVQGALMQIAAVGAGALGLGAILVAWLPTVLLDVTGVLGAGAIAALGLYLLPARRSKIKADLRIRITELRAKLDEVLNRQFEGELSASSQRLREAIAPYTRFVRVEREKLDKLEAALREQQAELTTLRQRIRGL